MTETQNAVFQEEERFERLLGEILACFQAERPGTPLAPSTDLFALMGIPNRCIAELRLRLAVQGRLGLVLPVGALDAVTSAADVARVLARDARKVTGGEFQALTDHEVLLRLARDGIPFNQSLAIRVESVYPDARLVLPYRPEIQQHVGMVAIGAICGALESVAGLAVAAQIDPSIYPLITVSLKIEMAAPLTTDMIAVSSIAPEAAEKLRRTLERMGHAILDGAATGFDTRGKKCAEMTCTFYLRKVKDWTAIARAVP